MTQVDNNKKMFIQQGWLGLNRIDKHVHAAKVRYLSCISTCASMSGTNTMSKNALECEPKLKTRVQIKREWEMKNKQPVTKSQILGEAFARYNELVMLQKNELIGFGLWLRSGPFTGPNDWGGQWIKLLMTTWNDNLGWNENVPNHPKWTDWWPTHEIE